MINLTFTIHALEQEAVMATFKVNLVCTKIEFYKKLSLSINYLLPTCLKYIINLIIP